MKITVNKQINVNELTKVLRLQFPKAVASYGEEEGGVVYVQGVQGSKSKAVVAIINSHNYLISTNINQYKIDREMAYSTAWTQAEFEEAYFEKEYEDKPEKMLALQAKRIKIKEQIN